MLFFTCVLLPVCLSQRSFVLYPPLHTPSLTTQLSIWSSIHPQTPFPPEQSISLLPFTQQKTFFPSFFFFLNFYHKSFIFYSINLFIVGFFCYLALFLPFSPFISHAASCHHTLPSHPELSYLAGVTAADVARPQTSVSPVPLHLYSADQTNRFNSLKLAVLTAALMCSWAAWAKSQLNMLQTHEAYTGNPRARLEMHGSNKLNF